MERVPPPTRGWPGFWARLLAGGGGSPAHAGMAPVASRQRRGSIWFPRPRGDGPAISAAMPKKARFPRPRGDGPGRQAELDAFTAVPPAHAGMATATDFVQAPRRPSAEGRCGAARRPDGVSNPGSSSSCRQGSRS